MGALSYPGTNMTRIVIIDDQAISRKLLAKLVGTLEDGPEVQSFADPVEALESIGRNPPDLVLTDYKMPHLDGVSFIRLLREMPQCTDVPIVVVTCIEDREIRYRALEAGATDFLTKPVDHVECRARCRNLLMLRRQQQIIKDRNRWLERRIADATAAIRTRERETLIRLAKAGEYRDEETGNHVLRMARYSRLIADELGLSHDDSRAIEIAAPMHDIGKIGIPDAILLKPGRHTPDEFATMKCHTLIGYDILKESPSKYLQMGATIALGHHEKYDGSGYPYGLAGEDIPLAARIVAVADVFDALTSVRPYKPAWPVQDALGYLRKERGGHFDPSCVDGFFKQFDRVKEVLHELADNRMQQSR